MNGKHLKKIRLSLKMSQKDFGNLLGLSRKTINSYENERKEIPQSKKDYFNKVLTPNKETADHAAIILKLDVINEKINLLLKNTLENGK